MGISGYRLLAAGTIVFAVAGCAAASQSLGRHDAHAAAHSVTGHSVAGHSVTGHSVTAASPVHHVQGRYLTKAAAERRALILAREMGQGPYIVAARLMSPEAANMATGQTAPGMFSLADAKTWLVWIRGTWRSFSCIVASQCGVSPHVLYYIGVDARTGAYDGTGYSASYPRGAP